MRLLFGVLLLISGVVSPMGMLFWINARMRREPHPRSKDIGLLLAFNGTLPVALIIGGMSLLSASMWGHMAIRIIMGACCLATLGLGGMMLWSRHTAHQKESERNGR